MAELNGQCMCGAVKWSSTGKVTRRLSCHCSDCQKATSSPFTTFLGLAPEMVNWTGEINHYESSHGTHRGFCLKCGSRLYFRSDKWPGEIHIHSATLDDASDYIPDAHVVMGSAASWLRLADDIPKHQSFQADPTDPDKE
ncbi:GFA family protein [Rhodobacteraceae bacterium B1Z28]|uniref:GFA family protein n=1 Tax=Ruegeria haliotis TaxID=2747601 RepID=A0ABX2PWA5_9RHOB|nr:GFA family protein [Ruegeria haliotis]NVO57832.1 GFA family protein [Ruegeria haliotis]